MTMLERRRLGRTGFMASVISLGTVEIGMPYGLAAEGETRSVSEQDAARLLHAALDLGVNFIDTARLYGESEAVIGRTLAARRQEYFLASKVATYDGQSLSCAERRLRIAESVEESVRQLRTDVIDLMQLHSAGVEAFATDELADILDELRERGLVRFTGASVYTEEAALAAISSGRYDCIQIAYNVLDRRPEREVLPAARDRDVGVVVRSVLLKGVLTGRYRTLPDSLKPLREAAASLESAAIACGTELPEAAYRYVLGQRYAMTALVGARSVAEVEAAAGYAARGPLDEALAYRIRQTEFEPEELLNPGNWSIE